MAVFGGCERGCPDGCCWVGGRWVGGAGWRDRCGGSGNGGNGPRAVDVTPQSAAEECCAAEVVVEDVVREL